LAGGGAGRTFAAMRVILFALALTACSSEPVSRSIGARCDVSSECDERCLTGGDFPGGFCSISCDNNTGCPNGTVCMNDQGGACMFTCAADPDCAFLGAGWTCKEVDAKPTGKVMVCRG
jgi:hypothetical protein